MPTSDNAAVVWRYLQEVLGGGRLELLDELVAPDYVDHTARAERSPGVAGIREVVRMFHTAFPDLAVTVQDCLMDRDRVASHPSATSARTAPATTIPLPSTTPPSILPYLPRPRPTNELIGSTLESW
jgi:hypothetical protein